MILNLSCDMLIIIQKFEVFEFEIFFKKKIYIFVDIFKDVTWMDFRDGVSIYPLSEDKVGTRYGMML